MEKYLKTLNDSQIDAVKTIDGPLLILAGAGTGKTKTITTRLAYLIGNGIPPDSTLTLTFTNKAALEMRHRAMTILNDMKHPLAFPPKLYTFHKFGLVFLRFFMDKLDRKNNFVIIDSDDKKKILKQFITNDELTPSVISNEISHYKNSLISPEDALGSSNVLGGVIEKKLKMIATIYEQYENYIKINNLVDFDDLLKLPYEILNNDENLKKEISNKYKYIMVDEYQDTNDLQFKLLKQLCSAHSNLCVVGDDDQSIYGWRGANIKNILSFDKEFKNTKVVKLEKNYRSTEEILKTANTLIFHNKNRHSKELMATLGKGKDVEVVISNDEKDEAYTIAKKIQKIASFGTPLSQIAILFRINALSRSIEDGLSKTNLAFRIIDSVRFYERMEVKDAISYLRFIINTNDDFSLKRVINRPKRGIGKTSLTKLEDYASSQKISIFNLISNSSENELSEIVGKKNSTTIKNFYEDITTLTQIAIQEPIKIIDEFEKKIKLRESYSNENERVLNIDEFYGVVRDYLKQNQSGSIEEFLNEITLESEQDKISTDMINLMSIHASKGLEFEYVFVIGLEDGFFPLLGEDSDIEEERRLGYVAYTRAKKELCLCSAKSRFFRGKRKEMIRSRFLTESGLVQGSIKIDEKSAFKKGDLIKHKLFGMGRITTISKVGKEYKLTINFGGSTKEILSNFVEKI